MSKNKSPSAMEDFDLLAQLVVGIGEVSEITGVPRRQLRYWESKAIISSVDHGESKNRRYDYINIKKTLLIKELLDEGFTLDAAARKISMRMENINKAFLKLKKSVKSGK